jgi:lysophospholipase L1-like esterase
MVYGDVLTALAHVTGSVSSDAWVEFRLDGAFSILDASSPFSAQFTNVESGEHSIEAVLYENTVAVSSDYREQVGARGDYYISIGDSITNGIGDFYALDNISSDLRIISTQGFQASLNNLLTEEMSYPHIIFNEGIGGDRSHQAANLRIPSILDRHTEFNKALVLLGTNDSSGLLPVTSNAFRTNMQSLIDRIPSGKQIWVGLVPPIFRTLDPTTDPRNELIQDYNQIIRNELTGILIGPDFYHFFLGSGINRSSLFSDALHPNALGYRVMATLWKNVLTGQSISPFFVDWLSPGHYKQNLLEAGNVYHVDSNSVLTGIPEELKDGVWIMTANADKTNASQAFLSFTVDRPVDVYVAYDASATQIPEWLNAFTETSLYIYTNGISTFKVYERPYPVPGQITLGGNLVAPASGDLAHYLVIVKER